VLSILVVDMPLAFGDDAIRTVILGSAIPVAWSGGKIKGLRLRGGGSVDFELDEQDVATHAQLYGRSTPVCHVDRNGKLLTEV
jgi:alpha-L-fucosidase 2